MDPFRSRCRAALLGAGIGDALSFPYRDYSRTFLMALARPVTRAYEAHRDGFHPAGQPAGDTQMALAAARAIAEARGVDRAVLADWLVPLWRDLAVVDPDPSVTEALRRLVRGETSPDTSGLPPGRAEAGALPLAIPVGLWNVGRLARIPDDTAAAIGLTHSDPRVQAAGAAVAAAVAFVIEREELILGDLLDAMDAAARHASPAVADTVQDLPRLLSQTDTRAWQLADQVLPDTAYPSRADGLGSYVVPVFLLTILHFLKSPNEPDQALDRVVRFGGRQGTAATLVGALAGARGGVEALPPVLLEGLGLRGALEEAADALCAVRERGAPSGDGAGRIEEVP